MMQAKTMLMYLSFRILVVYASSYFQLDKYTSLRWWCKNLYWNGIIWLIRWRLKFLSTWRAMIMCRQNENKKQSGQMKANTRSLYPLASRWVGLDASPLDSLILLSYSLSLVIPEILNREESSSGLLWSDLGSWDIGLGSWEVSLDFPDFSLLSADTDRCDRLPTYIGILVVPWVWNAGWLWEKDLGGSDAIEDGWECVELFYPCLESMHVERKILKSL